MEIVKADASLLDALMEVEEASFTVPWSRAGFQDALEADTVTVYAALEGEVLLGFSCVLIIGGEAELLNLAARPDRRREGIGGALLGEVLLTCRRAGCGTLYLEVRDSNTAARSLYRKNGFEAIGKRRNYYTRPREDAILMRKTLDGQPSGGDTL